MSWRLFMVNMDLLGAGAAVRTRCALLLTCCVRERQYTPAPLVLQTCTWLLQGDC